MGRVISKRMQQELTSFQLCFDIAIQINQLGFGKEVDDAKKVAPFDKVGVKMDEKHGRWNKSFMRQVKSLMGIMAIGGESIEAGESYQIRESSIHYGGHFWAKKDDIGPENTYYWNDNP